MVILDVIKVNVLHISPLTGNIQYNFTASCRSIVLHVHHNKLGLCTSPAASGVVSTEPLLSKEYNGYNAIITIFE